MNLLDAQMFGVNIQQLNIDRPELEGLEQFFKYRMKIVKRRLDKPSSGSSSRDTGDLYIINRGLTNHNPKSNGILPKVIGVLQEEEE